MLDEKPKGYWIGHVTPTQPEAYTSYAVAAKAAVSKFGGKYLVRAGKSTAPEGTWLLRAVVIEFADYETALACYNSTDYQAAKALRKDAADTNLLIIEGSPETLGGPAQMFQPPST